jgi:hypothetical protein
MNKGARVYVPILKMIWQGFISLTIVQYKVTEGADRFICPQRLRKNHEARVSLISDKENWRGVSAAKSSIMRSWLSEGWFACLLSVLKSNRLHEWHSGGSKSESNLCRRPPTPVVFFAYFFQPATAALGGDQPTSFLGSPSPTFNPSHSVLNGAYCPTSTNPL